MIRIPTSTESAWFSQTVQLAGTLLRMELHWNARAGFWVMNLATVDREPIVSGVRIVPDWDLVGRLADPRLPKGRLVAADQSGRGEPPGRDELGSRVILYFIPEEELIPGGQP